MCTEPSRYPLGEITGGLIQNLHAERLSAPKRSHFLNSFVVFVMCSSNVFSQCAIADHKCAGSSENNWKSWFEKQTLVGKGLSPLKLAHITIRDDSIP